MSDKYCTCDWVCDGSLHNQDGWLTPKPTITYEIVGDIETAIRADREKLAGLVESKCDKQRWRGYGTTDWYELHGCAVSTGEDGTLLCCSHMDDAKLIRNTPIGEEA